MAKYSVSDLMGMSASQKSVIQNPQISLVYVQPADIDGVNYVAGSTGKVKIIREYQDVAKTILLNTTTFKYEDASYPTQTTSVTVI